MIDKRVGGFVDRKNNNNNSSKTILPTTNENHCFEIRLESIGGLGANLCGKMLGELGAMYLGLNASSFSSYGSEKRGSAVKSFIRYSNPDREILINSPIEHPNILGIFHEEMAKKTFVMAGVKETSSIVINTSKTPEEIRKQFKIYGGTCYCIDGLKLAMETKSRINMIMLGAIIRASEFLPLDIAIQMAKDTIGKKYPAMIDANIDGIKAGYEQVVMKHFPVDNKYPYIPYREVRNKWGYNNAPIGGTNILFGNSISNDLSPSRQGYIPLFIKERCINCGLCDSTCPDMVFQFEKGMYKGKETAVNIGLDYHHCKGCLRCVDVCPTNALVQAKERDYETKPYFVRNKDLIVEEMEFEQVGANGWITSEAYLDEKRVDGGLV